MNKSRRARIAALADRVAELLSEVETIRDEEQEAFDNLPESLQNAERQAAMRATASLSACGAAKMTRGDPFSRAKPSCSFRIRERSASDALRVR